MNYETMNEWMTRISIYIFYFSNCDCIDIFYFICIVIVICKVIYAM